MQRCIHRYIDGGSRCRQSQRKRERRAFSAAAQGWPVDDHRCVRVWVTACAWSSPHRRFPQRAPCSPRMHTTISLWPCLKALQRRQRIDLQRQPHHFCVGQGHPNSLRTWRHRVCPQQTRLCVYRQAQQTRLCVCRWARFQQAQAMLTRGSRRAHQYAHREQAQLRPRPRLPLSRRRPMLARPAGQMDADARPFWPSDRTATDERLGMMWIGLGIGAQSSPPAPGQSQQPANTSSLRTQTFRGR